jgi:cytosine/adenosine deaminase-related metal-dependent hydrolase
MAARGPEATEGEVWRRDLDLARELDLYSSIHVGIGDLGPLHRAVTRMQEAGELGDDLIFIHANSCSDEEIAFIADAGAGVSIGVQVEMTSQGSGPIPTDRFLAAGIWPSLSGDTETMGSGDMFTQMRMALAEYRLKVGTGHGASGAPSTLLTEDALRMATLVGAETLGLGAVTGSISPGKAADIVLLDTDSVNLSPVNDPVGATVLAAHPGNVDTVIVAGQVLKRGKQLVNVDLERILALAEESNRRHPAER